VDRLFLDANVLFSASWKETSGVAELWRIEHATLLTAAIASGATHLITGDLRDFKPLFGRKIGGVLVLRPRDYLARR
jgi:hypothetical protein